MVTAEQSKTQARSHDILLRFIENQSLPYENETDWNSNQEVYIVIFKRIRFSCMHFWPRLRIILSTHVSLG